MNNLITIYVIAYNEEILLPYLIKHYRTRFTDCKIIIYDNYSTDNTAKIALQNNCVLRPYDSQGTIRDDYYIAIKNNCWKNWECNNWTWTQEEEISYLNNYPEIQASINNFEFSTGYQHYITLGHKEKRIVSQNVHHYDGICKTDWCIATDLDEFVDVTPSLLEKANFNIIKPTAYDMCVDNYDVDNCEYGIHSDGHCKICCWKPKEIQSINFEIGAHKANPIARPNHQLKFNDSPINLYHFKWLSWNYVMKKNQLYNLRLSEINKKNGWGIHYTFDIDKHRNYYENLVKNKIKVRDREINLKHF